MELSSDELIVRFRFCVELTMRVWSKVVSNGNEPVMFEEKTCERLIRDVVILEFNAKDHSKVELSTMVFTVAFNIWLVLCKDERFTVAFDKIDDVMLALAT